MGAQLRLPVAVLIFVTTCACDRDITGPTKSELTLRSAGTTNGVTFVSNTGLSLACGIDNSAVPSQGLSPIPPLTNPIPPLTNPIPLLVNPTQNAAAVATFAPPSISLNPRLLLPLLPAVQAFVFFRECGRFNIGQLTGPALSTSINCWSARRLRHMNLFGPSEQSAIQRFLEQTFLRGTPSAPSGAEQWRMMASCR